MRLFIVLMLFTTIHEKIEYMLFILRKISTYTFFYDEEWYNIKWIHMVSL